MCECVCPRCSHGYFPRCSVGTYYIYCTMTEMALDESGWTCWGKGGVKHLTVRGMYLSALVEISRQLVSYKLLCWRGYYCEFMTEHFSFDNHSLVVFSLHLYINMKHIYLRSIELNKNTISTYYNYYNPKVLPFKWLLYM